MSNVASLKERVLRAEEEAAYYKSLVESFETGIPTPGGNFKHFLMAQWGRKRLEEKGRQAVLLGGQG